MTFTPPRTPWTVEVHELSDGLSACVYDEWGSMLADHLTEDRAHLIASAPALYEALEDFEKSAALIANTASEIAPPEIAKMGADAWVRCLTNARAILALARGEPA